jgi:hypothetical protein
MDIVTMFNGLANSILSPLQTDWPVWILSPCSMGWPIQFCHHCRPIGQYGHCHHVQWAGQFNFVTIADRLASMDIVTMFIGLANSILSPLQTLARYIVTVTNELANPNLYTQQDGVV